MQSAPSARPRFCMRCHRKWTSNDRGHYIELKRGILCINCHMKITEKLERLKTRYAAARREVLPPLDVKTLASTTWIRQPGEQPLPEAKPELKKASQAAS